ncbi:hypothetical protein GCM10027590_31260 [Nocardiopsis nanhaiensis]
MVDRPGVTVPEIARRYGRSPHTVSKEWTRAKGFPSPTGRRGRYLEYDHTAVHTWVQANLKADTTLPIHTGPPEELLTKAEIAAESGLSPSTIRSDLSRGRLTPKHGDTQKDGVPLWRRGIISRQLSQRRQHGSSKLMGVGLSSTPAGGCTA